LNRLFDHQNFFIWIVFVIFGGVQNAGAQQQVHSLPVYSLQKHQDWSARVITDLFDGSLKTVQIETICRRLEISDRQLKTLRRRIAENRKNIQPRIMEFQAVFKEAIRIGEQRERTNEDSAKLTKLKTILMEYEN